MGKKDVKENKTNRSAPKAIDINAKDLVKNSGLLKTLARAWARRLSTIFGQGGLGGDIKGAIGNMFGSRVGDAAASVAWGSRARAPAAAAWATPSASAASHQGRGAGSPATAAAWAPRPEEEGRRRHPRRGGEHLRRAGQGADPPGHPPQHRADPLLLRERAADQAQPRRQGVGAFRHRPQRRRADREDRRRHDHEREHAQRVHPGAPALLEVPSPKGGGSVVVTYPFVFKQSGE